MNSFYLIDLNNGIYFSENNPQQSWIQAFKFGEYEHPLGKLDFSENNLTKLVEGVNSGKRGIKLAVDYDHRRKTDIASGWIEKAKLVKDQINPLNNGVYLLVEWTERAKQAILNKEYKYFSPEFDIKTFDLLGGGLTNRPFLKGMEPVNLSEFDNIESEIMTREQLLALATKLGLEYSDDISDEDLTNLVENYEPPTSSNDDDESSENDDDDDSSEEENLVSAGASTAELSEEAIAALAERDARIAKLEMANHIAGVKVKLSEYDGKLTPKLIGKLEKLVVKLSDDKAALVYDFVDGFFDDKNDLTVLLSEEITGKPVKDLSEDTLDDKLDAAIAKLMEENSDLSYVDALAQVNVKSPELFVEFRESVIGG